MSIKNVLALILGGGQGNRLFPLTVERAKPAVPLAGKYRLIDIPLSNCLHAGIEKIAILTQFNSASLHRHIWKTYSRDIFTHGLVQILAAEQTPRSSDWYQGTADAVRKQIVEIRQAGIKYVLILSGDHLYRMDYGNFVDFHIANDADITIAVQPVGYDAVSGFGILKLNTDQQITSFVEKPQNEAAWSDFISGSDPEKPFMASMGIYVFNADTLFNILEAEGDDFGKDLIPAAIRTDERVFGYQFAGYWEDIGTIRRFYEVNLSMANPDAPFDFYDTIRPIYTRARFLPGTEVFNARLNNVLLSDGCRIDNATVNNSVVGIRSVIGSGATLNSSILMGADHFESEDERILNRKLNRPDIGIGANSIIDGAIIDKNARIGHDVSIRMLADRKDEETKNWVAREGIIIIPKNGIIHDGSVI